MRTLLFAPASNARHVSRVFTAGADAAILDLEDAVAVSEKPAARSAAARALLQPRTCRVYVRVNALATEFCFGDLQEVVPSRPDGLILPMVHCAEDIMIADWTISQHEREAGIAPGSIELMPIIETARGLHEVEAIARRSTRVKRLAFGAGDYVNDVGLEWTKTEHELSYARSRISAASRIAQLQPPIDTAYVDIADLEGLAITATQARTQGFGGKFCIYPAQVPVVNAVFTPTDAEVDKARRIVAAFEEAEREGNAAIRVDGAFVDYPIVFRAQRVLENYRLAQTAGKPVTA